MSQPWPNPAPLPNPPRKAARIAGWALLIAFAGNAVYAALYAAGWLLGYGAGSILKAVMS